MEEGLGCTAMGNIYHIKCFTCTHCGDQLEGKPFYHIDNKPYCEEGYLVIYFIYFNNIIINNITLFYITL